MPYANKEQQRKATREATERRRNVVRQIIREAKSRPCMDCNITYPYFIMHFDHVKGNKLFGIAHVVQEPTKRNIELLLSEIAKCDIVCANCHGLRHGGVYYGVKR